MQQLLEISAWPTADVTAGHDKHLGHYAEGLGKPPDLNQPAVALLL
ncbi:hypothetical protein [Pseudomonas sp. MUP55]|nr:MULTISPECIES: hypothetical protein [unclassified Pseudomonas]WPN94232.1 hypothetical protein SC319_07615 [Pseudomonas sp. MUP56]WPN99759.1 hypothetical protein SC318_07615 [Pseudomonas sp. MUP55]